MWHPRDEMHSTVEGKRGSSGDILARRRSSANRLDIRSEDERLIMGIGDWKTVATIKASVVCKEVTGDTSWLSFNFSTSQVGTT